MVFHFDIDCAAVKIGKCIIRFDPDRAAIVLDCLPVIFKTFVGKTPINKGFGIIRPEIDCPA